jgi:hypothetical protein
MRRLKPSKTLTSCREGYAKLTCFNSISSSKETSEPLTPFVTGFGASMMVKKIEAALRAFEAAVRGTDMALRCATIVMIDIRTLDCQLIVVWYGYYIVLHHQRLDVGKPEVKVKLHSIPKA